MPDTAKEIAKRVHGMKNVMAKKVYDTPKGVHDG